MGHGRRRRSDADRDAVVDAIPRLSGVNPVGTAAIFGIHALKHIPSVQTATAYCPAGKVVVGGGGRVVDRSNTHRLALTQLEPSAGSRRQRDSGTATWLRRGPFPASPALARRGMGALRQPDRGPRHLPIGQPPIVAGHASREGGMPDGNGGSRIRGQVNNPIGPTGQQVWLEEPDPPRLVTSLVPRPTRIPMATRIVECQCSAIAHRSPRAIRSFRAFSDARLLSSRLQHRSARSTAG